jgi:hypothetical protein
MIEVPNHILRDLLFFSRRYCDGRRTYAPSEFNDIYMELEKLHGSALIRAIDMPDKTLMDGGNFWPYAQDGMYDEQTGHFDARREV